MAGVCLFGPLSEPLYGGGAVSLRHRLESVKILPRQGQNDPPDYGPISTALLGTIRDTSAATAQGARMAAILQAEYPDYWPESIRGLVVHSAEWTPQMLEEFPRGNLQVRKNRLRVYGMGVPNLERARRSAKGFATMVVQDQLQPFRQTNGDNATHEMYLHELPIPREVLEDLGEHTRLGPKVRNRCVSLLKSVNWMRVASLGLKHVSVPAIAAFASGGTSLVPAFAGSLASVLPSMQPQQSTDQPAIHATEKSDGESVDWESLIKEDKSPSGLLDVRTFREQFGKMLRECDVDSLVVLIDDLDRCSPERIIENLEAIKLFLNVDHTAFVIGADPRIVRHAISLKYHKQEHLSEEANAEAPATVVTDYLEKLIQYPIAIASAATSAVYWQNGNRPRAIKSVFNSMRAIGNSPRPRADATGLPVLRKAIHRQFVISCRVMDMRQVLN